MLDFIVCSVKIRNDSMSSINKISVIVMETDCSFEMWKQIPSKIERKQQNVKKTNTTIVTTFHS